MTMDFVGLWSCPVVGDLADVSCLEVPGWDEGL
jgi:hypothetical protein